MGVCCAKKQPQIYQISETSDEQKQKYAQIKKHPIIKVVEPIQLKLTAKQGIKIVQ